MIGRTLGHYRILEKIGAGGMGEVYRAHDERLNRDVALKVLPAGTLSDEPSRKRFRNEALTLSQLNHPNIAVVFDFDTQEGVDFLAMELVAGLTLAEKLKVGALPETEVRALGTQVLEALEEAHERSVVHRDLKPGNIVVTPKGRVKVLDFGLAKLLRPVTHEEATAESLGQTQAGTVRGTVPYMSPEQLRGEAVDARTDLYAAGAVLYEMATGRRTFSETQAPRLIDSILHQPPRSPREVNGRISAGLESVILKALEKDAARRYQSAKELLDDLERLSTGQAVSAPGQPRLQKRRMAILALGVVALLAATIALLVGLNVGGLRERLRGGAMSSRINSLAVLPFENAGNDPNSEYLSDGITESLIDNLSQIPNLKVIARTSVFRYKGRQTDPRVVGRELGVRAVVTGRVAQRGQRLTINVELVDARDDRHIWGEQYSRNLSDVLDLQESISRELSDKLRLRLSGQDEKRLGKRYTDNTEAYELYLKGHYFWRKFTSAGIRKGIEYFQQAIEKDPNYALAYAGLADCYGLGSVGGGGISPAEGMPKAKAAATKALEIDDDLAEAHLSLALVRTYYDWDWSGAEREFRRSIALNPNYAEAHHFYSHYFMALGRIEDSYVESKRALELDPLSPDLTWHLGWHYFFARRYDQAIEQTKKTFELDPSSGPAHIVLGYAYEQKGMFALAITEFKKVSGLSPGTPFGLSDLAHVHAVSGQRAEAVRILAELREMSKHRYVPSNYFAIVYTGLGEKDQAFEWLQKTFDEHSFWLGTLKVDPRLDVLRSDPRFQDLLRRMDLPP